MAKNEARRQKQLAKKKAKRQEKRTTIARETSKDPTLRFANAAEWPVIEALVAESINSEGIGQVCVARGMPGGGVACGIYLVDMMCLGVKGAFYRITSEFDYRDLVMNMSRSSRMDKVAPEYAVKLVLSSVIYARSFGFPPHADFRSARLLLAGIDPQACATEFEFGENGKPLYIRGPNESLARAHAIAHQVANAGGHFVIPQKADMMLGDDDFSDDDFESEGLLPDSR